MGVGKQHTTKTLNLSFWIWSQLKSLFLDPGNWDIMFKHFLHSKVEQVHQKNENKFGRNFRNSKDSPGNKSCWKGKKLIWYLFLATFFVSQIWRKKIALGLSAKSRSPILPKYECDIILGDFAWAPVWCPNGNRGDIILCQSVLSTSAKELNYLLVGKTSQGRGSTERDEALIHPIAISK